MANVTNYQWAAMKWKHEPYNTMWHTNMILAEKCDMLHIDLIPISNWHDSHTRIPQYSHGAHCIKYGHGSND